MDRRTFWKNKYIKEHKLYFFIGLVICAALIFILAKKTDLELSPLGWACICLAVIVFDVLSFMRRMNEYVRIQLMEEERQGMQKDGFSTIPEDDPRFEDIE